MTGPRVRWSARLRLVGLWIVRVSGFLGAAALVGVWSGCGDEEVRIVRTPIDVFAMEYTEPVIAAGDDSLLVRALVGYDDCQLEGAAIELRGDSLVVTGVAVCRIVERSNKVLTPPAEPNLETFQLPFPPVAPGTYVLSADGLGDTLTVTSSSSPAPSRRIAAHGYFFAADSCAAFSLDFVPQQYGLSDVELPTFSNSYELYGTFTSDPVCNPDQFEAQVRPRRLVPRLE